MKRLRFTVETADYIRQHNTPIIVTGAGGWLGQAVLEMLESALGAALPARVTVFTSRPRPLVLRSGAVLQAQSYEDLNHYHAAPAIIFHFAFLTREHAQVMPLETYIASNRSISHTMKNFIQRCGARGIFIPSSGAVYRAGGELAVNIVDNPYGVLKHEDELLFQSVALKLGIPVVIIRVFNLAGPFINKLDSYILACILNDILNGTVITLRAGHPVWRSYVHVEDVLNLATAMILRGLKVVPFDTAGETPVEISALALRAGELIGRQISINRPTWQTGQEDRYLGDFKNFLRIANLAGVRPQSLDRQIIDTYDYVESIR